MEDPGNRLRELFEKYLANQINEEEYVELWKTLQVDGKRHSLIQELQILWENSAGSRAPLSSEEWNSKMQALINNTDDTEDNIPPAHRLWISKTQKWLAAAAIALFLAGGYYLIQIKPSISKTELVSMQVHKDNTDILPGGNKAVLTLSNGASIILDSAANGLITRQGDASVSKAGSGRLAYNQLNGSASPVVYNTLRTPRGGQYQLKLPDGSMVWLNAASSIRFPTAFTGDKREVEMTGEIYFEIAPNPDKPFSVTVDGMKVNVLGTHFNIMAYDDEPLVKTTLLEGSVRVTKGNATALLKAGQQAQINKEGKITLLERIDPTEAIAWKDQLFWFEDDDIYSVMRRVSRWYDANVTITGKIPQHFTGSIPRDVKVSRVFEVLQETGSIHFQVNNKEIIVTP
jgi:hypothetical protein